MRIGYARVSTLGQDESLQTVALQATGCEKIFIDHASGAKTSRPELDRMFDLLRAGDTVVVWKLDRLGRSTQHLVSLINHFKDNGVEFVSLTENMDTSTPGRILIFTVFAAMAQFERDLIRERTRAGLTAARARGRKGGRPAKLAPGPDQGHSKPLHQSNTDRHPDGSAISRVEKDDLQRFKTVPYYCSTVVM